MKTEELLRYEAEYRAMQEAFDSFLLVFDYPKNNQDLSVIKEAPLPKQGEKNGG